MAEYLYKFREAHRTPEDMR